MVGIHFQVFKVNHYHLFFCIQSEILLHVNVSVLVINVYLLIYTLCIMMHETECSTVGLYTHILSIGARDVWSFSTCIIIDFFGGQIPQFK